MCRTVGCRSDSECDSGRACINGNCINPCVIDNPCGLNAECFVSGNRAECRCLSGYRGNPFESCRVIGCRSNSDCPSDKACENAVCVNPCVYDNVCSPRAECIPQNHMPICKCSEGFFGNPYVDCKREPQVECTVDGDCSSRLACINHECVNPCTTLEPCLQPSKCEVVPSLPVRTMICVCPEGYVSSGNGTCKVLEPVTRVGGCVADSDCPSDKACVNDICRNPCACAPNAICRVRDHKPICSCEQGYDGQPEIQCTHIGCRSDDECSTTHACINRQCVPACAADGSSCGERAECYGINHNAVCECRPGFTGNPKVGCNVIGCRADTECPTDKACINNKCESPCEQVSICERNEICRVYNHKPECSCPPGTISESDGTCRTYDVLCRDDSECPSQTACINSECINPCNATQPCGGKNFDKKKTISEKSHKICILILIFSIFLVNAECKVLDTVPVRTMVCVCIEGYQGNAAVQCDLSKFFRYLVFFFSKRFFFALNDAYLQFSLNFSSQLHSAELIKDMFAISTEIVYAHLVLEWISMAIVFHVVWKKASKLTKPDAVYVLLSVDSLSMSAEDVFVQQNTVISKHRLENVSYSQNHQAVSVTMNALIINSATLKQRHVKMFACTKCAA